MTAQQIITEAMRLCEELWPGQLPSPTESQQGLQVLNALLDHWSAKHEAVFVIDNKRFPLTSGQGTYTIGPGGDFDTERPVKIQSAGVVYFGLNGEEILENRQPLQLVNAKEYDAIPEKTAGALEPIKLYCDADFPRSTLYLWPVPYCPEEE